MERASERGVSIPHRFFVVMLMALFLVMFRIGTPHDFFSMNSTNSMIVKADTQGDTSDSYENGPEHLSAEAIERRTTAAYCLDKMVAYYPLDESAAPCRDFLEGPHADCQNCPTPVAGIVETAQRFDGSDVQLVIPDGEEKAFFDWARTDSFSIAFWMWTDQSAPGKRIILSRDGGATKLGLWIGFDAGGRAWFQLQDTTGQGISLGGKGPSVSDGRWHHIVAVREYIEGQASINSHNRIYVDGRLVDEGVEYCNAGFAERVDIRVGYSQLNPHCAYAGIVDELAFYAKALDLAEVKQLYINGQAGFGGCEPVTPLIVSSEEEAATVGQTYVYDVDATGNPPPVYTLSEAPAGMTIDPLTGWIEWTPSAPGTFDSCVDVDTDLQCFTIEVLPPANRHGDMTTKGGQPNIADGHVSRIHLPTSLQRPRVDPARRKDPLRAAVCYQNFEDYNAGVNPWGWQYTKAENGLVADNTLFTTMAVDDGIVYGTASSLSNIHSHFNVVTCDAGERFVYTGRMRISDDASGIGVTFLGDYPNSTDNYCLSRYGSRAFHLSTNGTAALDDAGDFDSGVMPVANTWYAFKVAVVDTGQRTEIRAKLWVEGTPEPGVWQIEAWDASGGRLTSGKIGVWSSSKGKKYWDDLGVTVNSDHVGF